ncbi:MULTISPECIES: LuxR C-terminal-related transcriptional regulator [unclassified Enterobacter cloacae complex]|uniref:helix-turn-helix transcriptional regulator n=2 Tax=unclassified Enterobacter cloacae complex TaxID=2757714 RepID=UPI001872C5A2|nr:hypothetical protein [Enterobacter cloacae complex sp. P41C]MBE4851978.1 hypothetical protein [Enterobacter cloacae complex sp. P41RS]
MIIYASKCPYQLYGMKHVIKNIFHERYILREYIIVFENKKNVTCECILMIDDDMFLDFDLLTLIRSSFIYSRIKTIIITKGNWPSKNEVVNIHDDIFLVNKRAIFSILENINCLSEFLSRNCLQYRYSHQERSVMRLLSDGYTFDESCKQLDISKKTISTHLSNLKSKAGTCSKQNLFFLHRLINKGDHYTDIKKSMSNNLRKWPHHLLLRNLL